MSFSVCRKLLRCLGISAFLWLAAPSVGWAQHSGAPCATFGVPCGAPCQTHHCPPAFKYCYEGPPRIHWQRGCPHPICNPCDLPHWGYFETCWSPWPFPPSWAHCPTPPPATFVNLNPHVGLPPVRTLQPGGTLQGPGTAPNGGYEEVPQLPQPRQQNRPGINP